ncbi:membrane lipoprotein lipid attachment site-containing protein [Streptomyces beijiangensis]|uniref:Membrane lipoprotein lipid attachment site-containing protein n=1 Tax=Streptomyces beijiangensis TaxID=163361 RepID=A0A939F4N6_9ACTN|nr:membrane lipoprotein lipid attachment site-containing protein [Streptomyces beijiangensis]MBO0512017.1 membrane lipoprotein lipid attachment site-containing protein [Streptomyces beijiangensis]
MRKILLAATAVACLALAGCNDSSSGDDSGNKPPEKLPSATATSGGETPGTAPEGAALALGTPARTVGARTVGILEITPTTVVHTGKSGGVTSKYGTFVVVTMREKSLSANPAEEEKPAAGGWKWLAPDGQTTVAGNGNSAQVSLGAYNSHGEIQPGDTQPRATVFDLTLAQARGGSAVYTDGTKAPFRWEIPAKDSGPDVADVRRQLNP